MTSSWWRERRRELLQVIPVLIALVTLREADVIADTPVWGYVLVLIAAYLGSSVVGALIEDDAPTRHLWWRAAVVVAGVTASIYVTGLGPMLAIGYVAVAADQIRTAGARAARPVLVWSLVGMVVGQSAVALDIAPSVVADDRSHGLAILAMLALVPTILLFSMVAGARERSEQTAARLLQLAGDLARATTVHEVCTRVATAVADVVKLDRAAVFLLDPETGRMSTAAVHGYPSPLAEALSSLDFGPEDAPVLLELVARPRIAQVTPDAEDPFVRAGFERFGAVESFLAPVVGSSGQVLGVLTADRMTGPTTGLSPDLSDRLQGLAGQASIALDNVRLLDQERSVADQLRESDRMKSEFLAVVSHELRTPLSVMMGAARTLQWRSEDLDPTMREELIDSVVRRGEGLNRLVEDLLQASTQIKLEVAAVDLAALVRTAVADAQSIHPDRELRWIAPEQPVVLPIDAVRIRQVVDNLVENATKYAPGGTISVEVGWIGEDGYLCVADAGPGLPADQSDRAFDAFFQGDSSAVRKVGGLGLGLHICRRIVDAHGGRIWMESAPGEGTRVKVRLPAV